MSHSTITLRRSKRSMITPPTVPRKKPGQHARRHHQADRGARVVGHARGDGEDGDEPDPVAEARDDLRESRAGRTPCCRRRRHGASRHGGSVGVGGDERRLALDGCSSGIRAYDPGAPGVGRRDRLPGRLLARAPSSPWPSSPWTSWRRSSSPWPSSRCAFFAVAFFLAGPRAARSRSRSTASSRVTASGSHAARHRGVGGAVGDVGTEAAVEHADRRAGLGVHAELGERRLRHAGPGRCFGWAKIASASASVTVKSWSSRLEAAAVGALLQVRPVATVLRGDLVAVGVGADDARQRQQLRAPPRA